MSVMKEKEVTPLLGTLEKIAFIFFLLSIPLSVRKVLLVFAPAPGIIFNEYTDISLYLSDILLFVFLTLLILRNKYSILSIAVWKKMFHVEHFKVFFLAPLPFIAWVAISIFWSRNETLALYALFKLLEGYFLYVATIIYFVPRGTFNNFQCSTWNIGNAFLPNQDRMFHVEHGDSRDINVPRGTWKNWLQKVIRKCSTWNIWMVSFLILILSGLFEAIVAISQFFMQSSLGLEVLKESILIPSGSGIAKIVLDGNTLIRPYGLFLHPNILAAFLGLTLLTSLIYPLVFHKSMFHVEHYRWIYRITIFIQAFAFLLTFSKSAILGLFIASLYMVHSMFHVEHGDSRDINVPRGTILGVWKMIFLKCSTWNKSIKSINHAMFHVEHLLAIVVLIITIYFIKGLDIGYFIIQPFKERMFFFQETLGVARGNFLEGVGIGQSVLVMQDFFSQKLMYWQFQPVHNLFLLIFTETGFIGLILFGLFIGTLVKGLFRNVPRGTSDGKKCSTWNMKNTLPDQKKMFHVEHVVTTNTNVPRGTFEDWNYIRLFFLSMAIFLGVISLADHYLWDTQQGQLLFWFILGLIASIQLCCQKKGIDKSK